jgi:hypothetical protein
MVGGVKMKKRFAFIVSDSGFIPGVNGMLNALDYYGTEVDFHLLYWGEETEAFAKSREDQIHKAVDLTKLVGTEHYPAHEKGMKEKAWHCKFYRYLYAIHECQEYDAVAIFDADMLIVNDITIYLEIAASLDRVVLPNNDWSNQEYDRINVEAIKGASSPPCHNMPLFFDPKKFKHVFEPLVEVAREVGVSDMAAVNHCLIRAGEMERVFALPNAFFVLSHYYNIKLHLRDVAGKKFLGLWQGGDRIVAVHRRWWSKAWCDKFSSDVKEDDARMIADNNIKHFNNLYRFFNTEWKWKIEWKDEFNY